MCGLAGILTNLGESVSHAELALMGQAIEHRGPDHQGVCLYPDDGIGMVHQRLSIVDLSESGHQPMMSACERYALVFNGEIYNHEELRLTLYTSNPTSVWRGRSDTETALATIAQYGIEQAVGRWTGMFAFALWDRQQKTLTLGRDRFGEKPLYAGWHKGRFYFASELRAIATNAEFDAVIDRAALAQYFRYHYVPAPRSIYTDIEKIAPGTLWTVKASEQAIKKTTYWDATTAALAARKAPFLGKRDEVLDQLHEKLHRAIVKQSIADVPLGAFLSGGIDSSLVVAIMQKANKQPVKTFSIGFENKEFDESGHAEAIAQHLGTDHTTLKLTEDEIRALMPEIPTKFDEPFADASQVPTLAVARLAREHVTVSLSGDGGDEMFGGYTRYAKASTAINTRKKLGIVGRGLSRALLQSGLMQVDPTGAAEHAGICRFLPRQAANRLVRILSLLDAQSDSHAYDNMTTFWNDELVVGGRREPLVRGVTDASLAEERLLNTGVEPDLAPWSLPGGLQLMDIKSYLVDDILCKVDRAAMHVSLETRVPLLDHSFAEFVWSIPDSLMQEGIRPKQLLFDLACREIPRQLLDRPKQGFGVPLADWLTGPLREWAESLLSEEALNSHGLLNATVAISLWQRLLDGETRLAEYVWSILAFQAWFMDPRRTSSH